MIITSRLRIIIILLICFTYGCNMIGSCGRGLLKKAPGAIDDAGVYIAKGKDKIANKPINVDFTKLAVFFEQADLDLYKKNPLIKKIVNRLIILNSNVPNDLKVGQRQLYDIQISVKLKEVLDEYRLQYDFDNTTGSLSIYMYDGSSVNIFNIYRLTRAAIPLYLFDQIK